MSYQYRVEYPGRKTVKVRAKNRLGAVEQAAKAWGVPWVAIAWQCQVVREKEVKRRGRVHTAGTGGDGASGRGD
ncbi:hypothetical protein [Pseudoflavonifractor sp. An85]|uniref:hypothetical protein n=1 Tax=Pseudoflavonifractor sp. An85 TaxID=1965661 RepID=UPI000B37DEB4|nr:hypothetical protein [Pseudoflavonifractor sp. An85]OUN21606.1 hypothetical protein B5G37_10925 [Pseudoflavonifractor sp. An85]